jgi:hypothetical protein
MVAVVRSPRPLTLLGSVAQPARVAQALAPGLTGRLVVGAADRAMRRAEPTPMTEGNLFQPSEGHAIDGGWRKESSPLVPLVLGVGGALGLGLLWATRQRR